MGHLPVACLGHGELFPLTGWRKPAKIEERAAVQGGAGNPHDSSKADERLFVNFISAHQIGVVAKVPKEPAEFPQCFGSAIESTVEGAALMFSWFENDEPQNVERPLGVPAVEEGSGARVAIAKIRSAGFGVDGGTLFASLRSDPAEAGATTVRTKSGSGTKMVGGRIPRDSRTGATV